MLCHKGNRKMDMMQAFRKKFKQHHNRPGMLLKGKLPGAKQKQLSVFFYRFKIYFYLYIAHLSIGNGVCLEPPV